MKKCLNNPIFRIISEVVTNEKVETYVIGGYVRDFLLNRMSSDRDIDIVVIGSGVKIAKKIAKKIDPKIKVAVFKNFGTAMFRYKNHEIDFVGARKESYRQDSRKPSVENGTLEDDQKRRDFTINAMAISLNGESYGKFIDPFNGLNDLIDKTIRTPMEPEKTFSDDPLRMMRAIRFVTRLKFGIAEETLLAISKNKERIKIVSPERIISELNKIVLSDSPSTGFGLLDKTGLLPLILPELHNLKGIEEVSGKQHKDNFYHTLGVLDNVANKSDDLWLRWAAILHDIAKPVTKKFNAKTGWTFHGHDFQGAKMIPGIFRRLRLPLNHEMKYVAKLVRLHLRPIALIHEEVTDSALRRLLFDAGNDIDDLMILCEADITSKNEKRIKLYLKNFGIVREKLKETEEKDAIRNFQPPVPGDLIMETFGLKPCKEIGIIKNAIKEAIIDGKIPNDYEPAYGFMLKKGKEMGLKPK
ncbi:MAG: HD domain-containing protein [Bacteroidetes bacterium]|nr:HD domain-containing protein [Bacteroidota bacterium]